MEGKVCGGMGYTCISWAKEECERGLKVGTKD